MSEWKKVIYMGLPMQLRDGPDGPEVSGLFSILLGTVIPFNGVFFEYRSIYPIALWRWLTDPDWAD